MENVFKDCATLRGIPVELDMNDVCMALVENAVEFLERNYDAKVLEQITDLTVLSVSYGDGSSTATTICRADKSFKN